MSVRIRDLEDALQSATDAKPSHPLLRDDLLLIKKSAELFGVDPHPTSNGQPQGLDVREHYLTHEGTPPVEDVGGPTLNLDGIDAPLIWRLSRIAVHRPMQMVATRSTVFPPIYSMSVTSSQRRVPSRSISTQTCDNVSWTCSLHRWRRSTCASRPPSMASGSALGIPYSRLV